MNPADLELPRDIDASGRGFDGAELELLRGVLDSGTLNATRGALAPRFEQAFAERMAASHGIACASGSAAVHTAVAALRLQPGDEVVTTAITDMGAIMPIVYEGAAAVFCDVEPQTGNVTAAAIEACLTSRTRAVIVTHLFGTPCDMAPILALARARDLVVIEDCAQAFLAEDAAGPVGTLGDVACYSFQQSKHMTTGEGGMVLTSSDALARHMRKFVNKGWGYGEDDPDHDFPALNSRITELQAAVGLAQLDRLGEAIARRRESAAELRALLPRGGAIALPPERPGTRSSYWRIPVLVDPEQVRGGPSALAAELAGRGVAAQPHYIRKPAYRTRVFENWRQFGVTRMAYENAGRVPQPACAMPGTEGALARMLVLPWNDRYQPAHVRAIAEALADGCAALA